MSYANIIGRNKEINILDRIYKSKKSELVAIYGRRRVGKSYLVSECFGKKILFKAVGTYIKDGDKDYESYRQLQLAHFYDSLVIAGLSTKESKPTCWREAFLLLRKVLEGKRNRRKIIFIDELPWLAGPQSSEMIAELGYFWNSWAAPLQLIGPIAPHREHGPRDYWRGEPIGLLLVVEQNVTSPLTRPSPKGRGNCLYSP
jgi:hypothetical protein